MVYIRRSLVVSLIMIILLSTLSFVSFSVVSGVSSGVFGNSSVGNVSVKFSTDKDATRVVLAENGVLQSITAYFANSGYWAKVALYTDIQATPGNLITQSNSEYISSSGWHTFTVSQLSFISAYYWLSVVSSVDWAQGTAVLGTSGWHCVKNTVSYYSAEFTNSFGSQNSYDSYSTSVYATYAPAGSSTSTTSSSSLSSSVFSDGFESGSISSWTGVASSVIMQSPVHAGSYAAKATGPNSYWYKTLSTGYNDLYFAGYIQISSTLSSGRTTLFLYILDASYSYSVAGGLQVDYSGNVRWVLRVNGNLYSSNTVTVQTGRWYFMEIRYSTSGTANLWVDGTSVASASGQALYNAARMVQGGNPTSWTPSGFVSYADDYIVNTSYINPGTTVTSQPSPTSPPTVSTQFGFGVYSDQTCTSKVSNFDWGTLSPGTSKSITVYVRNEGGVSITLQKQMLNVNPVNLGSYLTVDWDYNGQMLAAGQILRVTLVLRVSSQIVGINNFGFDVVVTATG